MSKVFAITQGYVGNPDGPEYELVKGALYDSDDPAVVAAPSLFAPVSESTDARVSSLEAQVKDLLAALAEKDAAPKPTAKKATAAAKEDV